MNKIQQRRLCFVIFFLLGLGIAAGLILYALKQNLNAFLTPSQLVMAHPNNDYTLRLGGVVKKGSVMHDTQGLGVHFTVTDFKQEVHVYFNGVLPDLFREGKGMIADGHLNQQGIFIATQVLAKHDENYTPIKPGSS